jgi:flagellar hook-basal body complex protein FliE
VLDPVSATAALPELASAAPPATATSGDFATWLTQQLGELNSQLTQASSEVRELAVGGNVSVHQVMIDLEKAKLSLQLMVQVRNKLLEAYQNIMQMQV